MTPSRAAWLYFVSGAVALGCETIWYRALALVLGSTLAATAGVLAGFMLGLALGSAAGAWFADRSRAPLRVYAACEAIVGVSALASPVAIGALMERLPHLAPGARIAVGIAALLVPTIPMGITFPIFVGWLARSTGAAASIEKLYARNLIGGAAGAMVLGWALPKYGIAACAHALGSVAFVVALLAALWPRGELGEREPVRRGRLDALALVLACGTGLVSFALQVAWNRAFALLLGSSATTFAHVLSFILIWGGLGAIGNARAAERWARSSAMRLVGLAIAIFIGMLLLHVVPFYLQQVARHGERAITASRALVLGVLVAPSYLTAGLFTLFAMRACPARPGESAGVTLFATTTGNIAGALVAAFVAIPSHGLTWTLASLALASLALACLAASRDGWERLRATALASAFAIALGWLLYPGADAVALSAGTFRTAAYRDARGADATPCGAGARFERPRALFVRDGALGTVAVLGHAAGPDCSLYSLRVNGKAEGSVYVRAPLGDHVPTDAITIPAGDLPTELLAGWIPGMAGSRPERALVVGWGTGLSARALYETGVGDLQGVEIEPAVLEAARRFDAGLFAAPGVHLRIDDGRMVLAAASPDRYDVIASHPSNPWVVGAAALFSRAYFHLARTRLRAGGRFMAWVQLYDADVEVARGLIATFTAEFPDAYVFRPRSDGRDLLLLGIRSERETSIDALRTTMLARWTPRAAAVLARAGLADVDALLATVLLHGSALARAGRGARLETDDDPWIEYRVAAHMLAGDGESPERIVAALAEP